MDSSIDIFVPGRLCLFGEHSDWAGIHRMINADIVPGYAIVSGVEQGIYATVRKYETFAVRSALEIYQGECLECVMGDELDRVAQEGGFFSYVAGVASYVRNNYSVGGLEINITKMDLPIKSGLSSSAAICVLVAKAFNEIYHLKLNINGIMRIAYMGEQRTPSRCGRLDQACAYGVKPVFMKFDGSEVTSNEVALGCKLYYVVADLKAKKDTVHILSKLNKCYPFAANEKERRVHEALGKDNEAFVKQAVGYMQNGEAKALGELMCRFQGNFDAKVAPACPEELNAPILHAILNDEDIKQWIYGAKGVGSQGDGTVQFLAKDKKCQGLLIDYLERRKKMPAFPLTLTPGQKVKKAIIPLAGWGTRMYPATKFIKKAYLPVMDKDRTVKPQILILLEQLIDAEIEKICLVVGKGEEKIYRRLFETIDEEHFSHLKPEQQKYEIEIENIGKKICYVEQKEQIGFGHAVSLCKEFCEGEPVLLLLGDMLYESYEKSNCFEQMLDVYMQYGKPMIAIQPVELEQVIHYGIIKGQWMDTEERIMRIDCMKEKPSVDIAIRELASAGEGGKNQYYSVFGQYILTTEIFTQLEKNIREKVRSNGEYQLTDALSEMIAKSGMLAFRPNGKSYDLGLPENYYRTFIEFAQNKTDLKEE